MRRRCRCKSYVSWMIRGAYLAVVRCGYGTRALDERAGRHGASRARQCQQQQHQHQHSRLTHHRARTPAASAAAGAGRTPRRCARTSSARGRGTPTPRAYVVVGGARARSIGDRARRARARIARTRRTLQTRKIRLFENRNAQFLKELACAKTVKLRLSLGWRSALQP